MPEKYVLDISHWIMNNCANTASVAFLRMLNEHDCDIFIIPINEYIVMAQRGKRIQS